MACSSDVSRELSRRAPHPLPKLTKQTWQALLGVLGVTAAAFGIYFLVRAPAVAPPAPATHGAQAVVRAQPGGEGVLAVTVVDENGHAVAGARVSVRPADNERTVVGIGQADAQGQTSVRALLDGSFSVLVEKAGSARTIVPATVAARRGSVRITLHPGATLVGRVVDDGGHAVANASVSVRPENDDSVEPWLLSTDDDGGFSFNTLQTGMQRLTVTASGFESTTRRSVTTTSDSPLRIDLLRTSTLAGHVRAAPGNSIDGASVVLAGSGVWPPRQIRVGSDGAFQVSDVPGGVYELRAHAGSLVAEPREGIFLEPGARIDVDLVLAPGRELRGVVFDADGDAPLAGVEVLVTEDALSFAPRAVRTNAAGEFAVDGLRDRPHAVSVRADGFVAVIGQSERPGGEVVRIGLRRAATISGTVVDARGNPVRGAQVEISGTTDSGVRAMLSGGALAFQSALFAAQLAGPRPLQQNGELGVTSGGVPPIPLVPSVSGAPTAAVGDFTTGFGTDPEGRFRITGVPPGRIRLTARHLAYAPAETPTRVVTAGAVLDDVRIVLPDGGVIDGRVVDARGYPVPMVRVELTGENEPYPRGLLAGSDGAFEFRGVLGALTVTAYPVGQPASRVRVDIEAGQTLSVSVPLEANMVRLFGRVLDSREFPVGFAEVRVKSLRTRSPMTQTTESEEDGTFSFDALPEPPYQIEVDHPDYAITRLARVASVDREISVRLVEGVLTHGSVHDSVSGAPVAGARVHLVSADNVFDAESNVDGAFDLLRVPAGDYTLGIEADAFVPYEGPAHIAVRRGDTELTLDDVRLVSGGSISGEVIDRYGELVSGAEVVVGEALDWTHAAHTDPHGHFVIAGVPAGDAVLAARHPAAGTTETMSRVRVFAGEETPGVLLRLPERFDPARAVIADTPRATLAATLRDAANGVEVRSVRRGSRAEAVGLRAGDIITSIDEVQVTRARDATQSLRGAEGEEVALDLERNGRAMRLLVPRERAP